MGSSTEELGLHQAVKGEPRLQQKEKRGVGVQSGKKQMVWSRVLAQRVKDVGVWHQDGPVWLEGNSCEGHALQGLGTGQQ